MPVRSILEAANEHVGVYVPDANVSVSCPMVKIIHKMKWSVLPLFLRDRASLFIENDKLIQSLPCYRAAAMYAMAKMKGLVIPDYRLVDFAESYYGVRVGARPNYEVSRSAYFDWKQRYAGAKSFADRNLELMQEYILRHILKASDFSLELRAAYLRWIARMLYKEVCGSDKRVQLKATPQDWFEKTKGEFEDALEKSVVEQARKCSFSEYNFEAMRSFLGPESSALCQLMEAHAKERLHSAFDDARKELSLFDASIRQSLDTGSMRENELKLECKIFKSTVGCVIEDVGGGLIFARKAKKSAGRVAAATAWTAALGALTFVFPPAALAIPAVVKDCLTSD